MALTGPTKESKVTTAATKPKGKAGRPKKARLPYEEKDRARLADRIREAELSRDQAAQAYAGNKSVSSELGLLQGDLAVASAWAAYLRAEGNHIHALKYTENATRIAGRISSLRELQAVDTLDELRDRAQKEQAAARRAGGH